MSASIAYDNTKPKVKGASQLPRPTGYRILLLLPEVKEKTDGGVYIPEERMLAESVASVTGYVAKMGPDCYKDKNRFKSGPWCREGDWVLLQSYAGTRIKVHGQEMRLVNDDCIEAVIDDPRGISRV